MYKKRTAANRFEKIIELSKQFGGVYLAVDIEKVLCGG